MMRGELALNIRYALRGLMRDRVFTIIALLSIGLGVGANSAIFSLVDQALFRQLPVREPERLVLLDWNGSFVGSGWGSSNLNSYPFYRELSANNSVFDGVFARHPTTVHLAVENTPEPVNAEIVSGTYFSVLGVRPAAGRLFEASDDLQPGAHPVVVVSYDYWQNRLGGAPDAVGRKVQLNNHPMTIIGVAAAGFRGMDWGEVPSLWVPTMMKRVATPEWDWLENRRGRWLHVFGRLKPGVSREQAQASLQPWFKSMLEEDTRREGFPQISEDHRRRFLASKLDVLPASHGRSDLRGQLERPLWMLLAATGLVLLLACLNVANLLLARAFARRRELALRVALGASRPRIMRELLVQSGILALGGALLGVLIAPAVTQALITFVRQNIAESVDLSSAIQPRVLLFSVAVAVAVGLLFGIIPALRASRAQPAATLKEESSTVAGGIGLRKALVTAQVALALVLLIGAGLFVRTLQSLRTKGPGFSTTNLLMFRVEPRKSGFTSQQADAITRNVLTSLRALPETESAAISAAGLLSGGSWNGPMTIDTPERRVTERSVHMNAVSPGFFQTLGVRLLRGRDFDDRDVSEGQDLGAADVPPSFRSAIVNESFARRYFGTANPIGARLGFGNRPTTQTTIEIVGVVETFTYRGLRTTDDQAFFPYFEGSPGSAGYFVRTRVSSEAAFSTIRRTVAGVNPALTVSYLRTVEDQLDRTLVNERLLATLASAFAALAVVLAVIGLYGVISFVVTQRTREIAIRLALGATRAATLWLVVRQAAFLVAAGLAIALPTVWALGRYVQAQLFGVRPMDLVTIASAAALIAVVALGSSALPARRAASLNPMQALRHE